MLEKSIKPQLDGQLEARTHCDAGTGCKPV